VLVYRRSIGFVFQSYALFPHLTVFENVAYGLRVKRLAEAAIRERVGRVLDLVGLPSHEARFPSQLSGGEQQRVAVARAVVGEPQLLLFDEPLSNLDAKLRVQMRAELSRLQRQLAITTIYVTHDQEEAMAISDRIAVMRDGRIAQVGTARELYAAPRDAFVAQFIGRVNLVAARRVGPGEVDFWGCRVKLGDGAETGAAGAVSLVLRPESVARLPPDARTPEGHPAVTGVVRACMFLGEKAEYAVEAEGALLQAVVYDPLHRGLFEIGAPVRVCCDPVSLRPLADSAAAR
jgi:iron(III) transport system ATP-binding protein